LLGPSLVFSPLNFKVLDKSDMREKKTVKSQNVCLSFLSDRYILFIHLRSYLLSHYPGTTLTPT
jgi:hypothetical protein